MEKWEGKLVTARSMLMEQLSSHIFSEFIDLEGGFMRIVFNN